jgi:hypothetical protein
MRIIFFFFFFCIMHNARNVFFLEALIKKQAYLECFIILESKVQVTGSVATTGKGRDGIGW